MQKIAILGSTGSIGTQALDVIKHSTEEFEVSLLSADNNWQLLASQAIEFDAAAVVITNASHYDSLSSALSSTDIKVYAGVDALCQEVQNGEINTVLTAITGFAGLAPTISAIKASKKIALANKETLVTAGDLIIPMAMDYKAPILPVDSEHSAIFQCLLGENDVERLILTASGGALRDMPIEQLHKATVEQVLSHPAWNMGAKITVDSATMLNKGFEIIEAHHLFGMKHSEIDVVIHPEAIVHSMIQLKDGAIKAQLGMPDMRLPIQYAFTFPRRAVMPQCEKYNPLGTLTFKEVDMERYPCLKLSYQAMEQGGIMPTVLNAAGEIAVGAFLNNQINYGDIAPIIGRVLGEIECKKLESIEELILIDARARDITKKLIKK